MTRMKSVALSVLAWCSGIEITITIRIYFRLTVISQQRSFQLVQGSWRHIMIRPHAVLWLFHLSLIPKMKGFITPRPWFCPTILIGIESLD